MAQPRSGLLNRCIETQPAQHAHAIGLRGDPAAFRAPRGVALDQFDRESLGMEGARQGEPGDPAPNNQYCLDFGHSLSVGRAIVMATLCRLPEG